MVFAASIDGFSGRSNAPAALAVPARDNGSEGDMVTEERGGMAGLTMGRARFIRPWSGKESPLFVTADPRRGTGICPDGTEKKAGRAWDQVEGRKGIRSSARYLGMFAALVAQTRHRRYCATVISRGMA